MNKIIIAFFATSSFIFSNIFAEAHEIPKLSQEEKQKAKKTNWQPWAVSVITILIAGTGVYFVSTHKGHKDNHNK